MPLARRLLKQTLLLTTAFHALGVAAVCLLVVLLDRTRPDLASRLLDWPTIAAFGLSLGLLNGLICWNGYVRLYRIDPFLRPGLIASTVLAVAVLIGGTLGGATGIAAAHLLTMAAVSLPLHIPTIRRELAVVERAARERSADAAGTA